jgi:hypothetical protein
MCAEYWSFEEYGSAFSSVRMFTTLLLPIGCITRHNTPDRIARDPARPNPIDETNIAPGHNQIHVSLPKLAEAAPLDPGSRLRIVDENNFITARTCRKNAARRVVVGIAIAPE